jgi:hypothetical protein
MKDEPERMPAVSQGYSVFRVPGSSNPGTLRERRSEPGMVRRSWCIGRLGTVKNDR